jgi:hypothetical protein
LPGIDGYFLQFTNEMSFLIEEEKELIPISKEMLPIELVQTKTNNFFFAEQSGEIERLVHLTCAEGKPKTQAVFQCQGSRIIAIENDASHQRYSNGPLKQSIFMLDDQVIIRQIVSRDDNNFSVLREVNLSHISSLETKVKQLGNMDWRHVVISDRTITLPDYSTYSLEADLNIFYDERDGEKRWKFRDPSHGKTIRNTIQYIG